MKRFTLLGALILGGALIVSPSAHATFHLMQIEQVIGGVDGDTAAQAIQLRMRANGQNFVSGGQLVVRDASGSNPVTIIDFTTDVASGSAGSRVLIATPEFIAATDGTGSADFQMTNPIPASYLAAGTLTFENNGGGTPVFRLSWGGSGYTGATNGTFDNDADADYGTPFSGALPSSGLVALQFQGNASAASTTNDADYALTSGAATFTNNSGETFTVQGTAPPAIPQVPAGAPVGGACWIAVMVALLGAAATRRSEFAE